MLKMCMVHPKIIFNIYKNADFIITNSFHATVFSIIFEKKFVTFKTKKVLRGWLIY